MAAAGSGGAPAAAAAKTAAGMDVLMAQASAAQSMLQFRSAAATLAAVVAASEEDVDRALRRGLLESVMHILTACPAPEVRRRAAFCLVNATSSPQRADFAVRQGLPASIMEALQRGDADSATAAYLAGAAANLCVAPTAGGPEVMGSAEAVAAAILIALARPHALLSLFPARWLAAVGSHPGVAAALCGDARLAPLLTALIATDYVPLQREVARGVAALCNQADGVAVTLGAAGVSPILSGLVAAGGGDAADGLTKRYLATVLQRCAQLPAARAVVVGMAGGVLVAAAISEDAATCAQAVDALGHIAETAGLHASLLQQHDISGLLHALLTTSMDAAARAARVMLGLSATPAGAEAACTPTNLAALAAVFPSLPQLPAYYAAGALSNAAQFPGPALDALAASLMVDCVTDALSADADTGPTDVWEVPATRAMLLTLLRLSAHRSLHELLLAKRAAAALGRVFPHSDGYARALAVATVANLCRNTATHAALQRAGVLGGIVGLLEDTDAAVSDAALACVRNLCQTPALRAGFIGAGLPPALVRRLCSAGGGGEAQTAALLRLAAVVSGDVTSHAAFLAPAFLALCASLLADVGGGLLHLAAQVVAELCLPAASRTVVVAWSGGSGVNDDGGSVQAPPEPVSLPTLALAAAAAVDVDAQQVLLRLLVNATAADACRAALMPDPRLATLVATTLQSTSDGTALLSLTLAANLAASPAAPPLLVATGIGAGLVRALRSRHTPPVHKCMAARALVRLVRHRDPVLEPLLAEEHLVPVCDALMARGADYRLAVLAALLAVSAAWAPAVLHELVASQAAMTAVALLAAHSDATSAAALASLLCTLSFLPSQRRLLMQRFHADFPRLILTWLTAPEPATQRLAAALVANMAESRDIPHLHTPFYFAALVTRLSAPIDDAVLLELLRGITALASRPTGCTGVASAALPQLATALHSPSADVASAATDALANLAATPGLPAADLAVACVALAARYAPPPPPPPSSSTASSSRVASALLSWRSGGSTAVVAMSGNPMPPSGVLVYLNATAAAGFNLPPPAAAHLARLMSEAPAGSVAHALAATASLNATLTAWRAEARAGTAEATAAVAGTNALALAAGLAAAPHASYALLLHCVRIATGGVYAGALQALQWVAALASAVVLPTTPDVQRAACVMLASALSRGARAAATPEERAASRGLVAIPQVLGTLLVNATSTTERVTQAAAVSGLATLATAGWLPPWLDVPSLVRSFLTILGDTAPSPARVAMRSDALRALAGIMLTHTVALGDTAASLVAGATTYAATTASTDPRAQFFACIATGCLWLQAPTAVLCSAAVGTAASRFLAWCRTLMRKPALASSDVVQQGVAAVVMGMSQRGALLPPGDMHIAHLAVEAAGVVDTHQLRVTLLQAATRLVPRHRYRMVLLGAPACTVYAALAALPVDEHHNVHTALLVLLNELAAAYVGDHAHQILLPLVTTFLPAPGSAPADGEQAALATRWLATVAQDSGAAHHLLATGVLRALESVAADGMAATAAPPTYAWDAVRAVTNIAAHCARAAHDLAALRAPAWLVALYVAERSAPDGAWPRVAAVALANAALSARFVLAARQQPGFSHPLLLRTATSSSSSPTTTATPASNHDSSLLPLAEASVVANFVGHVDVPTAPDLTGLVTGLCDRLTDVAADGTESSHRAALLQGVANLATYSEVWDAVPAAVVDALVRVVHTRLHTLLEAYDATDAASAPTVALAVRAVQSMALVPALAAAIWEPRLVVAATRLHYALRTGGVAVGNTPDLLAAAVVNLLVGRPSDAHVQFAGCVAPDAAVQAALFRVHNPPHVLHLDAIVAANAYLPLQPPRPAGVSGGGGGSPLLLLVDRLVQVAGAVAAATFAPGGADVRLLRRAAANLLAVPGSGHEPRTASSIFVAFRPLLAGLLRDPEAGDDRPALVRALAAVGGVPAVRPLIAPLLADGWWAFPPADPDAARELAAVINLLTVNDLCVMACHAGLPTAPSIRYWDARGFHAARKAIRRVTDAVGGGSGSGAVAWHMLDAVNDTLFAAERQRLLHPDVAVGATSCVYRAWGTLAGDGVSYAAGGTLVTEASRHWARTRWGRTAAALAGVATPPQDGGGEAPRGVGGLERGGGDGNIGGGLHSTLSLGGGGSAGRAAMLSVDALVRYPHSAPPPLYLTWSNDRLAMLAMAAGGIMRGVSLLLPVMEGDGAVARWLAYHAATRPAVMRDRAAREGGDISSAVCLPGDDGWLSSRGLALAPALPPVLPPAADGATVTLPPLARAAASRCGTRGSLTHDRGAVVAMLAAACHAGRDMTPQHVAAAALLTAHASRLHYVPAPGATLLALANLLSRGWATMQAVLRAWGMLPLSLLAGATPPVHTAVPPQVARDRPSLASVAGMAAAAVGRGVHPAPDAGAAAAAAAATAAATLWPSPARLYRRANALEVLPPPPGGFASTAHAALVWHAHLLSVLPLSWDGAGTTCQRPACVAARLQARLWAPWDAAVVWAAPARSGRLAESPVLSTQHVMLRRLLAPGDLATDGADALDGATCACTHAVAAAVPSMPPMRPAGIHSCLQAAVDMAAGRRPLSVLYHTPPLHVDRLLAVCLRLSLDKLLVRRAATAPHAAPYVLEAALAMAATAGRHGAYLFGPAHLLAGPVLARVFTSASPQPHGWDEVAHTLLAALPTLRTTLAAVAPALAAVTADTPDLWAANALASAALASHAADTSWPRARAAPTTADSHHHPAVVCSPLATTLGALVRCSPLPAVRLLAVSMAARSAAHTPSGAGHDVDAVVQGAVNDVDGEVAAVARYATVASFALHTQRATPVTALSEATGFARRLLAIAVPPRRNRFAWEQSLPAAVAAVAAQPGVAHALRPLLGQCVAALAADPHSRSRALAMQATLLAALEATLAQLAGSAEACAPAPHLLARFIGNIAGVRVAGRLLAPLTAATLCLRPRPESTPPAWPAATLAALVAAPATGHAASSLTPTSWRLATAAALASVVDSHGGGLSDALVAQLVTRVAAAPDPDDYLYAICLARLAAGPPASRPALAAAARALASPAAVMVVPSAAAAHDANLARLQAALHMAATPGARDTLTSVHWMSTVALLLDVLECGAGDCEDSASVYAVLLARHLRAARDRLLDTAHVAEVGRLAGRLVSRLERVSLAAHPSAVAAVVEWRPGHGTVLPSGAAPPPAWKMEIMGLMTGDSHFKKTTSTPTCTKSNRAEGRGEGGEYQAHGPINRTHTHPCLHGAAQIGAQVRWDERLHVARAHLRQAQALQHALVVHHLERRVKRHDGVGAGVVTVHQHGGGRLRRQHHKRQVQAADGDAGRGAQWRRGHEGGGGSGGRGGRGGRGGDRSGDNGVSGGSGGSTRRWRRGSTGSGRAARGGASWRRLLATLRRSGCGGGCRPQRRHGCATHSCRRRRDGCRGTRRRMRRGCCRGGGGCLCHAVALYQQPHRHLLLQQVLRHAPLRCHARSPRSLHSLQ